MFEGSLMNTKTKEGARNKGNPYFLRVPWNKGGLVNTGPGVSILNFSTCRKVLSLLRSMTWVLGTGDCKTREILHFPPFRLRSLTEETGYKRPGLGLFDGPCTLTGSEEI